MMTPFTLLSRREAIKTVFAGLATLFAVPMLPVSPACAADDSKNKILIVYYSRTGNTRTVAEQIHKSTGGELLELKTAHSYPAEYRPTTDQAKRELEENFRPVLTSDVESVQPYEVIFIGYPIWWGTMPMAFFTFLEKHDFTGKTLVPFCTHQGSGLGRAPDDIEKLCPGANILEALAVPGGSAYRAQGTVDAWLKRIGVLQ